VRYLVSARHAFEVQAVSDIEELDADRFAVRVDVDDPPIVEEPLLLRVARPMCRKET
jgi:hypothetical protein